MSITLNTERIGNVTSSQIYKVMSNGKGIGGIGAPAVTYIEEVNLERKLGRCIKTEAYSKPMAWGTFLENHVFYLLPFEYELCSNTTNVHPTFDFWAGSTDMIVPGKKIGELKCYEPKHFAQYTDALLTEDVQVIKKNCAEEYWQLVSNAIINGVTTAEAIAYMPYQSELPTLRELAENFDGIDQWKYRYIAESPDENLPYLPDGGFYKNLNRFEFAIPQEDIDALTERMKLIKTLLTKREY